MAEDEEVEQMVEFMNYVWAQAMFNLGASPDLVNKVYAEVTKEMEIAYFNQALKDD